MKRSRRDLRAHSSRHVPASDVGTELPRRSDGACSLALLRGDLARPPARSDRGLDDSRSANRFCLGVEVSAASRRNSPRPRRLRRTLALCSTGRMPDRAAICFRSGRDRILSKPAYISPTGSLTDALKTLETTPDLWRPTTAKCDMAVDWFDGQTRLASGSMGRRSRRDCRRSLREPRSRTIDISWRWRSAISEWRGWFVEGMTKRSPGSSRVLAFTDLERVQVYGARAEQRGYLSCAPGSIRQGRWRRSIEPWQIQDRRRWHRLACRRRWVARGSPTF